MTCFELNDENFLKPIEIALELLEDLVTDSQFKEVIELWENPSIGSEFRGIKLIGTRAEFRMLLQQLGIQHNCSILTEAEIAAKSVKTNSAKTQLNEITPDIEHERLDFVLAVPLIEEYIESGEPEITRFNGYRFGSALSEIPPDSEVYQSIRKELIS
jgi:hypothetical protein